MLMPFFWQRVHGDGDTYVFLPENPWRWRYSRFLRKDPWQWWYIRFSCFVGGSLSNQSARNKSVERKKQGSKKHMRPQTKAVTQQADTVALIAVASTRRTHHLRTPWTVIAFPLGEQAADKVICWKLNSTYQDCTTPSPRTQKVVGTRRFKTLGWNQSRPHQASNRVFGRESN